MIEVIHVDQGELLFKFMPLMPFVQVVEIITDQLRIPSSLVLLYDSQGFIMDPVSFLALPDDSQLFLFRRDSVNNSSLVAQVSWENFKAFPKVNTYELPFSFENYTNVSEKGQKIEKSLYELYCISKQLYARFMVKYEYLEKCKNMIDIRLKASNVLLFNVKHYYKKIKIYWKRVFKKAFEMVGRYDYAERNFSILYEALPSQFFDKDTTRVIKKAKIKKFVEKGFRKAKNYWKQLNDLKIMILTRIKIDLASIRGLVDRVSAFYQNCTLMSSNFDIKSKLAHFENLLKVCDLYTDCREIIGEIVEKDGKSKKKAWNQLLRIEEKISGFKELAMQSGRILNEIDPIERPINECLYRVDELYKVKIITATSAASQKLKYKVKAKLEKLEKKLDTLKEFEKFLDAPMKIETAYLSAVNLTEIHQENRENIRAKYMEIFEEIKKLQENRKEFLNVHGWVLPENAFPELLAPILPNLEIEKILQTFPVLPEKKTCLVSLDSEMIHEYYEKELEKYKNCISEKSHNSEIRQQNLYKDIKSATCEIIELESHKNSIDTNIKNILQELKLLKGNKDYMKNFSEELSNLKEKEANFKGMFMEQLKDMHEINSRLKSECSETPK